MQYCSLQHQTLLPSLVTSTTGYCFHFGSISSFFLELFLHWSPVAYWAPADLGRSSFSVQSLSFSYFSWGSQCKNTEVICHSLLPVDHILSELSTMTHTSWVALHDMTHNIELDKAVVHVISLILISVFCDCGFHSVCPLMEKDKRLMEASWWERLRGRLGLFWWAGPCSVNL